MKFSTYPTNTCEVYVTVDPYEVWLGLLREIVSENTSVPLHDNFDSKVGPKRKENAHTSTHQQIEQIFLKTNYVGSTLHKGTFVNQAFT